MIKCEDSKVSIVGTKEDIAAEFSAIYNALFNFFDRKEIEEIEEHTRKFIKKEMED